MVQFRFPASELHYFIFPHFQNLHSAWSTWFIHFFFFYGNGYNFFIIDRGESKSRVKLGGYYFVCAYMGSTHRSSTTTTTGLYLYLSLFIFLFIEGKWNMHTGCLPQQLTNTIYSQYKLHFLCKNYSHSQCLNSKIEEKKTKKKIII